MLSNLVYGKHKKYGEWLEKIFRSIYGDSQKIVVSYQKTHVAKEAAEDREYIEQKAVRWFILALYGFYFFQVLQRKDNAEIVGGERDLKLIAERNDTVLKAMNAGFGGDDTPARICINLINQWTSSSGKTPEYMTVEMLMAHFDFSINSGKDEHAFREDNSRFFRLVRDKRIIPTLYEFLGQDDSDINRMLELVSGAYDGFSNGEDESLPDWLQKGSKV